MRVVSLLLFTAILFVLFGMSVAASDTEEIGLPLSETAAPALHRSASSEKQGYVLLNTQFLLPDGTWTDPVSWDDTEAVQATSRIVLDAMEAAGVTSCEMPEEELANAHYIEYSKLMLPDGSWTELIPEGDEEAWNEAARIVIEAYEAAGILNEEP